MNYRAALNRLYFLFIILHLFSATELLRAEQKTTSSLERNNNISINLGGAYKGAIGIRYERQLTPYFSLTVPVNIETIRYSLMPQLAIEATRMFGWGIFPTFLFDTGIGTKFFFHNFYAEPMVRLGYVMNNRPEPIGRLDLFVLEPGINIGYQTIFDFGLLLNVGLGGAGRIFFPMLENPVLMPEFTVALGYAW